MAGVPHHSLENYLVALLDRGLPRGHMRPGRGLQAQHWFGGAQGNARVDPWHAARTFSAL